MNKFSKVVKTLILSVAIVSLPWGIGACNNIGNRTRVTTEPLETNKTVTETDPVTGESIVSPDENGTTETTVTPSETTMPTETKSEEVIETTGIETLPTTSVAPTSTETKPKTTTTTTKSTAKTTKAPTKKPTAKPTSKPAATKAPTKRPTKKPKPTNTPTPKPYTYCTCDAVVKIHSTGEKHTFEGLTAHKTHAGVWVLTDSSEEKIQSWLIKNRDGSAYAVTKLKNKCNYRYKA